MPGIEPESGPSWAERAELSSLAAVLDQADHAGAKNQVIDKIHKRALGRAIGPMDGLAVLDYGCGNGRLSGWMADQGAVVHGVDPCAAMIDVARRAVPAASFSLSDGDHIPAEDESADLVLSGLVLQYVASQPAALYSAVRELARVVRLGGRLVAIEQVQDGGLDRGASSHQYTEAIDRAGLLLVSMETARRSDSWVGRAAYRLPQFGRLPIVPAAISWESARRRAALVGGVYAEVVYVATRP